MDVDCRLFSSSLTLREVMELLFAVGALRWRLARVLLLSMRFGRMGGFVKWGVSHNSPSIQGGHSGRVRVVPITLSINI